MDGSRTLLACRGALVAALLAALVAGCAQTGPQRDAAPSAALEDLVAPEKAKPTEPQMGGLSLAEAARRAADDLARDFTRGPVQPPPEPDGKQRPWQNRGDERATTQPPTQSQTPTLGERAAAGEAVASEQAGRATTETTPAEPEPDPIALLLEMLEAQSDDPARALAASMLAQAVRGYAGIDDGSRPGQSLSPPERELADLFEPLLEALASGDRSDAPARIGRAVEDAARGLPAILPVRINDAALATDIYGFAAYRAFPSYAFLAGRSNRVLLYTEPAGFQSRLTADPNSQGQAANPGAYEVLLGLELQLYNERGSMLAWRRAEERVSIRSDRPRSEVYLGTMIDLPASLSVGRYQLKVIVRDHADGSEDERVIPIEIVADPRLTSPSTRDR